MANIHVFKIESMSWQVELLPIPFYLKLSEMVVCLKRIEAKEYVVNVITNLNLRILYEKWGRSKEGGVHQYKTVYPC